MYAKCSSYKPTLLLGKNGMNRHFACYRQPSAHRVPSTIVKDRITHKRRTRRGSLCAMRTLLQVSFSLLWYSGIRQHASCLAWRCERKLGSPQRDRCNIFACHRTYTTSVLLTTTKRRRQRGGLECRTYNFCSLLPFQVPSETTRRKRGKHTWKRSMLQYVVCWCSNTTQ